MIDGIDGSGKSTIITTWKEQLESMGKRVFSIKDFWSEHGVHPTPADADDYDVVLSAEPTNVWTGAAIRQEMIQQGNSYTGAATAAAYALDRLILYTRFLVPVRNAGKIIIQDRGVSTSLCYQSIQGGLSLESLASIEGNAFALEHAPDMLVLTHILPDQALTRIGVRHDKQDNAIFEQKSFLDRAHAQFHSTEYQDYFVQKGTQIHTLDTDAPLEDMTKRAQALLQILLS